MERELDRLMTGIATAFAAYRRDPNTDLVRVVEEQEQKHQVQPGITAKILKTILEVLEDEKRQLEPGSDDVKTNPGTGAGECASIDKSFETRDK